MSVGERRVTGRDLKDITEFLTTRGIMNKLLKDVGTAVFGIIGAIMITLPEIVIGLALIVVLLGV